MNSPYLIPDLKRDEGVRLKAYRDSRGIWTIGVGHNLQVDPTLYAQLQHLIDVGITPGQCDLLLEADTANLAVRLRTLLPWLPKLDPIRSDVISNLAFNLGVDGLMKWHHTLGFAQSGDYSSAGSAILASEPWAGQVGNRAIRLSRQMASGVHQSLPA